MVLSSAAVCALTKGRHHAIDHNIVPKSIAYNPPQPGYGTGGVLATTAAIVSAKRSGRTGLVKWATNPASLLRRIPRRLVFCLKRHL